MAAEASLGYAATKAEVEAKVEAYVTLANGDLTTQALADAAKAAKAEINLTGLKDADQPALQAKVDAADAKVATAEAALKVVTLDKVKATASKTLTVTFNKAVDTTKATFEVKKGSSTIGVNETIWNEDKTAVQLVLNSTLTEGTYNVAVKGLGEKDLTSSVAVQNQKVTQIKLLSDSLLLANATGDSATVGYQALNQYGEDVTTNTALAGSFTVTTSKGTGVTDNKGKITVQDFLTLKLETKFLLR